MNRRAKCRISNLCLNKDQNQSIGKSKLFPLTIIFFSLW